MPKLPLFWQINNLLRRKLRFLRLAPGDGGKVLFSELNSVSVFFLLSGDFLYLCYT